MNKQAKLHKRHISLSFHRVCQAIAAKVLVFYHMNGDIIPADILSNNWGYSQIWAAIFVILAWGYYNIGRKRMAISTLWVVIHLLSY